MSKSITLTQLVSLLAASLLAVGATACGPRHQGAATGAAIGGAVGAGTGAAIGSASNNTGTGALVGGAVGAATGAIVGDVHDQSKVSTEEQDSFIARQKEEMERQERELEDLRRQKLHDDYYRSQYE